MRCALWKWKSITDREDCGCHTVAQPHTVAEPATFQEDSDLLLPAAYPKFVSKKFVRKKLSCAEISYIYTCHVLHGICGEI